MLKAKSSLRMLRVTWHVQNDLIFGIPEAILPYYTLYNFYGPTMTIRGRL